VITLIKDLGMQQHGKYKRRYAEVLCGGCNETHVVQMGQLKAGYTSWCKSCGIRNNKKD